MHTEILILKIGKLDKICISTTLIRLTCYMIMEVRRMEGYGIKEVREVRKRKYILLRESIYVYIHLFYKNIVFKLDIVILVNLIVF